MQIITTHYIDAAFVPSHGREVVDIIRPTDRRVIGRVTMADQEDTRRAIAAAKRAFATYGRSTMEERAKLLRRLHEVASERIDQLTAAMVEEYGGVVRFARMKKERGSPMQIVVQMVRMERNADEVDAFTRFWSEVPGVDQVFAFKGPAGLPPSPPAS